MTLLKRLFGRCSHRLSWPRIGNDGRHYQTCLSCGATFAYNWDEMRTVGPLRLDRNSEQNWSETGANI